VTAINRGMLNVMRREVLRVLASKVTSTVGTVAGYDPNNYAVKVQLQPDGLITGRHRSRSVTDWPSISNECVERF